MKHSIIFMGIIIILLFIGTSPARSETVLFDQGHGQRFVIDEKGGLQLSSLAEIFAANDYQVHADNDQLTDANLSATDVLIISGPFMSLAPTEIDAIKRFLDRGGKMAVMLHIGQPLAELLHGLGVDFTNGVVHEQHDILGEDSLNFRVSRFNPTPVTKDLESFSLHGGWALMNTGDNAEIIASTSPDAWVDMDGDGKLSAADAVQSFGIIVIGRQGSGRFIVFGDDAIFQNRFLDEANRQLAVNLSQWLK